MIHFQNHKGMENSVGSESWSARPPFGASYLAKKVEVLSYSIAF
jgi:hypothetical protein